MPSSLREKAELFRDAHRRSGCVLMPNAWDAGSARLLESAGFDFILTTSAGVAFSLGLPDYGAPSGAQRVSREQAMARIAEMSGAIEAPLSADLESGYGPADEDVAETVRQALRAGAVGGNLEDVDPESHRLFEVERAVARISAARQAAEAADIPFVINARTDALIIDGPEGLAEAIDRGNRFLAAGADCVFVPGAADAKTISALVAGIDGPVSVVMGLTGHALSLADLDRLGVRRVSIGGAIIRAFYAFIMEAARDMRERGSFAWAEEQLPTKTINEIMARVAPCA